MILAAAFVVAALAFPAFVLADVQDNCSVTTSVILYENGAGDNSDGDDELWLCRADYTNLNNISHTIPGNCNKGAGGFSTTWNDCVSSVKVNTLAAGTYTCFYRSSLGTPNNDLLLQVSTANDNITHTFGGANNDALSGVDARTSPCPDPAP